MFNYNSGALNGMTNSAINQLTQNQQGPLPQNFSGVNPYQYANAYSDDYATDTYAGIIRDEYQDYQNRFVPVEQQYRDMVLNPTEMLDKQLSRITSNTNKSYDRNAKSLEMVNQRYGIQQTQEQKSFNSRQSDMQKGLAIAHGKNSSRVATKDRQMSMMANAGGMRPETTTQGGY